MIELSRSSSALAIAVFLAAGSAGPGRAALKFHSTDRKLIAFVIPVGKQRGFEGSESQIDIRKGGKLLRSHDFASEDGDHGYGVDGAHWTPDSQFFVCRMRSSGGHSPMYAPVVFWSRRTNRFYQLKDFTADQTISISAPDKLSVDTWPAVNPATVWLENIPSGKATELH